MADNSGVLKIGLFAGAAYLAYKQGWLSMLGIGAPAASVPVTPVVPVTPIADPNAIVGANTIDGIYQRFQTAAKGFTSGTIDEWNTYVAAIGITPPDPMPLFQAAVPGFDRSQKITLAQYWAVMSPALKTQLGLSGIGVSGYLARVGMGWY